MDNEISYILNGRRFGNHLVARMSHRAEGEPSSVLFDSSKVGRSTVGWWHSHPGSIASPSFTDFATMRAWCFALGRPLLCAIDGIDGLRGFYWLDDERDPVEVPVKRIGFVLHANLEKCHG